MSITLEKMLEELTSNHKDVTLLLDEEGLFYCGINCILGDVSTVGISASEEFLTESVRKCYELASVSFEHMRQVVMREYSYLQFFARADNVGTNLFAWNVQKTGGEVEHYRRETFESIITKLYYKLKKEKEG